VVVGPCSDSNALNPNELAGAVRLILNLKAKRYSLSNTLSQGVERSSLGIAAPKLWNAGHIITSLVPLDDDSKFSLRGSSH